MITTEQEYVHTRKLAQEFAARLETIHATAASGAASRMAGTRSQLAAFQRELAMWEADIRQCVPSTPIGPVSDLTEEQYEAFSPEERAACGRKLAVRVKQAEIANIDAQIGLALDRIADWRRHRAWLEREIAALEEPAMASAAR